MFHHHTRTRRGAIAAVAAVAAAAALALSGCVSSNPLDTQGGSTASGSSGPIVIGSQDYYSNEIIANIYAQALQQNGFTVDLQPRIGQREAYLPEIEAGKIDLFPEYTGNLLQFFDKSATATTSDDVYAALKKAVPKGLRVLDQSPATDQDSYNVTKAFAEKYHLKSLSDLVNVTEPITIGGNTELKTRPYGPAGLKSQYGVSVGFTAIEDSGGPLTVKAVVDNQVQMVDMYSASPAIHSSGLVTLDDPKGMFLASHVVPLVSSKVDAKAAAIINKISAAMSPADLVAMNDESVSQQKSAKDIAANWLKQKSLF